jgi:cytidine deaminase/uridine phosphorylase
MSGFAVGAALLIEDQNQNKQFVKGTNYETQNYRSVCAEKHALQSAHLNFGHKNQFPKLIKIAIYSPNSNEPIVPCGDCRQALFEQNPDLNVLCIGANQTYREFKVHELLPFGFRLNPDSSEEQSNKHNCSHSHQALPLSNVSTVAKKDIPVEPIISSEVNIEVVSEKITQQNIGKNSDSNIFASTLRDYIVHLPVIENKLADLVGLESLIVVGSPARAQKLLNYFKQRFSSDSTHVSSNNVIDWGVADISNYCHIVSGNTDREYSLFIIHWPDIDFKVGIASHGIGASGVEIVLSEVSALIALANSKYLIKQNAQNTNQSKIPLKAVIRSGTRGTISNASLGTIAITTEAFSEQDQILPNSDLTEELENAAKELGLSVEKGACLSAQFFWSGQGRTPFPLLRQDKNSLDIKNNAYLRSLQTKGIKWIEMEDYYLHHFSSEYGVASASLGLVVAKRYDELTDQFLLSYDSDTKKDKELAPAEIALLSLKNFFDKQNNKANLRSRIVREIENNGDRTI